MAAHHTDDAMSAEKNYATAPCSICGRDMRVKKDGTIGHHGGELGKGWMFNRAYSCDGVGQPPVEPAP